MLFSSHIFIFLFLPLVLLGYYCLPAGRLKLRNALILVASLVFYAWLNPWFPALMLAVTGVNYFASGFMSRKQAAQSQRVALLTAAIILNLSVLGFFKYFVFIQNNLNHIVTVFGAQAFPVLKVVLPVGVSFYTFKVISYLVDVYRRRSEHARSLIDFASYVSFFPQVLSGPIQRFGTIDPKSEHLSTFADQLADRSHTLQKFSQGAALFILGLAKKILLANVIARSADAVFAAQTPCTLDAWFGAIAYALQLYIDFSAYSEMAIGLGLMMGFECPRNFNAPYLSNSITDFWRRWHISLSSWFRDYLYIPLGGSRTSVSRSYLNLVIVFLLCGLWHGASWTFVVWGTFHGLLLVLERALGRKTFYAHLPRALQILATFALIVIGWVFFRAENISHAVGYLSAMFGAAGAQGGSILLAGRIYGAGSLIIMAICVASVFQPVQAFDWARNITLPKAISLLLLFCLSLSVMFTQTFTSFLYFRF